MMRTCLKRRLYSLNRDWQGRQALLPVDICYTILAVVAWVVFLAGVTNVLTIYVEHTSAALSHPSFWAICVPPILAVCAALCRRPSFPVRFTLIVLALLTQFLFSTLEGGVMPNTSLYAIVLVTATSLFFGFRAGMAALVVVGTIFLASAWSWTHGYLPLTLSRSESSELLLGFRSPFVWLRVLPIMALFMIALLSVLHFVLERLRATHHEINTTQRLLAVEQEQRARAEIEHDRQRRLFRVLFDTANDAIFQMDENSILTCNRRTEVMFGCRPEEVIGQSPVRFSPSHQPDGASSADRARERIAAALAGAPQSFEWRHQRVDGTLFDAEVSLNRVELAGTVFLLAIVRDVTARKQAETALRGSEERYRQMAKCVPDLIWTTDLTGRITYVSSMIERNYGWTIPEALQLNIRDLSTPEQAARDAAMIAEGLSLAASPHYDRNRVRTFESEELRKDGSRFWAEVSAAFVWSDEGVPAGIIGITRDITARKRAEAERQELQARLIQAQKMEAVGQLAGGVAHDFNNILTAITLQLELLQNEQRLTAEARSGLKELEGEAKRASGLTRQLLMFSRRQVLQTQVIELNSLLGNVLKMLRRLIGEHINLEFNGAVGDLWLEADPGMLEQVVMNLVVNARDAMPGGGRVTLTTRAVTLDASTRSRNPEAYPGPFVCLVVADTGTGMDEATVKHIFEPFFTTKEAGKGTGLGLATVYGIAKQHKGWVEVETAVGRGSTFSVFLPGRRQTSAVLEPTVEVATVPGGREQVLVVEDESSVRRVLVQMLKSLGYQVWEAANGPEALQQWTEQSGKFDLVVTDIVMPGGLSGAELADRLQQLKRDLKVILMSGYSPDTAAHGLPNNRGRHFLQKPFAAAALARLVRESLDAG